VTWRFFATTSSAGSPSASEQVFDSVKGIDVPTVDVPPGRSIEWPVAYAVADSGDVTMTVDLMALSMGYAKAMFVS